MDNVSSIEHGNALNALCQKSTKSKLRTLRSIATVANGARRVPARRLSVSPIAITTGSHSTAVTNTELISLHRDVHVFTPLASPRFKVSSESALNFDREPDTQSEYHSGTDPVSVNNTSRSQTDINIVQSKVVKRSLDDVRADVKALGDTTEDQANLGLKLLELSQEMRQIYDDDWEQATLEEAIHLVRSSLPKLSDDVKRNEGLRQLAKFLYQYHDDDFDEDGACIKESVQIYRKLYEGGDKDGILDEFSDSLNDLYLFSADLTVFNEALSVASERLANHAGRISLAESLGAMSDLWADRFDHMGERVAIEKAVEYSRERLDLHPFAHSMRGTSLYSLASLLTTHAIEFWSENSIEEALQSFQEALPLFPVGHEERNDVLSEYAEGLSYYYEIAGNASGLQSAITIFRDLLATGELEENDRLNILEGYARAMQNLYASTKDLSDLVGAITLYQEAVDQHSGDESESYMLIMHKALAHWTHYEATTDLAELDEGIRLLRQSLALSPPADCALILSNLAGALLTKHEKVHDEKSVHEARQTYEEAIQEFHPDHPIVMDCHARLSECYSSRYYSQQDLQKAGELILYAVCIPTSSPTYRLDYCWEALKVLQDVLALRESMAESLVTIIIQIYRRLIDLLPRVAHFGRDLNGRLKSLNEADDIGMGASFYSLQMGRSDIGQALELLEAARCIFWAQALRLRRTNLVELPQDTAEELKQLLEDLEDGSYSPRANAVHREFDDGIDANAMAMRQKAERVNTILEDIRRKPHLQRFMLGLDWTSLISVASEGFVVILIPGNQRGSEAIILQPGGLNAAQRIFLDVKQADLETWGSALQESHSGRRRAPREARLKLLKSVTHAGTRDKNMHQLLAQLWYKIVLPILRALRLQPATGRDRPRLHWCPTGLFAFLPLHAAGNYNISVRDEGYLFDYAVSSYTPTLTALLTARHEFMNMSLMDSHALLIAESAAPGLVPLPNVEQERNTVRDTLLKAGVQSQTSSDWQTTKEAVASRLPQASIAHFACHGVQDSDNPLQSGFCLQDGVLTVADLMHLHLPNAVFAFLSACETAQGDREQPNQAIHLCAALLFCGFKSVIGTMWGMSDEDGPIVAEAVYRELCSKGTITADDIAYALDTAVGELRALHPRPDRWAPFVHIGA